MKNKTWIACLLIGAICSACNHRTPESKGEEYYTYGSATLLADESLYPIVDDEHEVFSSWYKRTDVKILYKPLNNLLSLFLGDSLDVAIIPRELRPDEAEYFEKRKIKVRSTKFAIDGIGLITGKNNPDSTLSKADLIALLSGKSNKNQTLVFDNPQSSTVEYLMDLAGVKELPQQKVYSLKSNPEVIKYIRENPEAIGVVSVNWIKRPTPELVEDVNEVKFLAVDNEKGQYKLPSQSNLKTGDYPLCRDLYLIDCQGKAGLGTGFAAFLASDIGQRIILKAGLAPDSLPSRQIIIRN